MRDIETFEFLPFQLRESLKKDGILSLRDFQIKGILSGIKGRNLVIVAPTGSGKTLIGEILAVLSVIKKGKSLILVPYKALAEEMKNTLDRRYPFVKIGISTGDYRERSINRVGLENDLIVLTYEKADLLRREMPSWMKLVKIIVIDEVHLLSDLSRGSLLDAVITAFKLRKYQIIALSATIPNGDEIAEWMDAELITSNFRPVKLLEGVYFPKNECIYFYDPAPSQPEVITINNTHSTSKYVSTSGQQIQLDDFVNNDEKEIIEKQISEKLGKDIEIKAIYPIKTAYIKRKTMYDSITKVIEDIMERKSYEGDVFCEKIIRPPIKLRGTIGSILELIYDLLEKANRYGSDWQTLIFRRSRRLAQTTSKKIAQYLQKLGLSKKYREKTEDIIKKIKNLGEETAITDELIDVIRNGVAFHHAGLTYEERKLIEEAFRQKKIGIIVATPTLGAGINIPARRVIIETLYYDPIYGYQQISVAQYKQRAGRAGRPGLDNIGEAILIAKTEQDITNLFNKYVFGDLEIIRSRLGHDLPALRQQLLAFIASQETPVTFRHIINFFKSTFFYWQCEKYGDYYAIDTLRNNLKKSLELLIEWGFVQAETRENKAMYVTTKIGRKISLLYLDPMSAYHILAMLKDIGINISTKEDLIARLLLAISSTPDTSNFRHRLLTNMTRLSNFILKLPASLSKLVNDNIDKELLHLIKLMSHDHYYEISAYEEEKIGSIGLTSMLLLWINGHPLQEIIDYFSPNFGAGDFRELIRLYDWLLYCTREIAKIIEMSLSVIKQIEALRLRIQHGVTEDLLELVKIPGVGRVRASILMKHGYKTLEDLSKSNISELESIPGIGEKIAKRIIEYVRKLRK